MAPAAVLARLGLVLVRRDHHGGYQVLEGFGRSLVGPGIDLAVVVFDHRNRRSPVDLVHPSFVGIQCEVLASTMQPPRSGKQK